LKRSNALFLIIAVVFAAVFVRLGIWQLDRRGQRLAMNERIRSRIDAPARPVAAIEPDTVRSRFSSAIVTGTVDYEHEIVLTHRGHDGAPGVDFLTPVRAAGNDTATLVNRGWVYSADAATVDRAHWHDTTSTFVGYVDAFESRPQDTVREGRIRKVSYEAIARTMPYPVRPFYVVAMGDSASTPPQMIRLERPKLDEGPHLSYAFQWFGFATITLIGAGVVTARSMRGTSGSVSGSGSIG
jgi:surfeit locus 1 family protein